MTSTNSGLIQASVRAVTGTAGSYEGDWHALFTMDGIAAGPFSQRLLAWINQQTSHTYTELNGAMVAYAVSVGANDWSGLGTFSPGYSGGLDSQSAKESGLIYYLGWM